VFDYAYQAGTDTLQSRAVSVGGSLYVTETYDNNGVLMMKDFASGNQQWFYENGDMQRAVVVSSTAQNTGSSQIVGGVEYEYFDDHFYEDGTGRMSKVTYSDGSYDVYDEYYPSSSNVKTIKRYSSNDNLIATFRYDPGKNLISAQTTTTSGIGNTVTSIGNLSMAANGNLVWIASDGNDNEVYLYNGSIIVNVSDNGLDDRDPSVNTFGDVAWSGFDDTPIINDYGIRMIINSDDISYASGTHDRPADAGSP